MVGKLLLPVLAACGSTPPANAPAPDAPGASYDASSIDAPAIDAPVGTGTDPAGDGASTVSTATTSIPGATPGRNVPATIYTPSPANGALVVISPGFQMARTQYASYAQHLATWGFTAILTDYADSSFFADHQALADDVGAVVTFGLALPGIDPMKVAVAGHSLGGDISTLAAADDPRIAAVVGWDPVDASSPSVVPEKMATMHAALAVIGETTDGAGGGMPCAPTADNFRQFYAAASSPALVMTVVGADHMDWVDDATCALCSFCTAGSAPPELARVATRRLDVAWLRRTLFGDATMDPWLAAPPEVTAGTAMVERK